MFKFYERSKKISQLESTIFSLKKRNLELEQRNQALQRINTELQSKMDILSISNPQPDDISEEEKFSNKLHAIRYLKSQFGYNFYCLDDVDLDILNNFTIKTKRVIEGKYRPPIETLNKHKIFFNFDKRLTKREYFHILLDLIGLKITSRKYESLCNELGYDETIAITEKLYMLLLE